MSFKPKNSLFLNAWIWVFVVASALLLVSWPASVAVLVSSACLILHFNTIFERQQKNTIETLQVNAYTSQQQAKAIQEQLDMLMANFPHPLVLFNQKGQAILSNATLKALVKVDTFPLMYDDKQLPRSFLKLFKQAYHQELPMIQDVAFERHFYSVHCLPVYVEQRYQGFLCVFQDVTRLVAQEKLQKRFVADASHELKTPITAIKGISELLCRETAMSEVDRADFTRQLFEQSLRLEKIVKDLLTLSRLNEDKLMISKQRYNAKALIEEIVSSLHMQFNQYAIDVRSFINEKTLLYVDKLAFEGIMNNLLNNVIIHANAKTVTIQVEENFEFVIVKVSDDGKGIEPEHLPHVFERFYRASSSRHRSSGGSGLGLNIVRGYVQAHQGSIEVSSKINQGCTFTMYFPKLTLF